MRRRRFLWIAAAGGLAPLAARSRSMRFQPAQDVSPLLQKLTGGVAPETGGVEIELPQIAENGNSVPMRVKVASPMSEADHVTAIHIVAERNPRPLVATFHLGPRAGRAEIATRIRLAGTQRVVVVAALSGNRFRTGQMDVLVTSAACLDESL
ncbi:MAG TPA: thiosulfate oxidation carrier protein SoxY [Usitatibacter sp.]|nr:thiosulfate oxidation carrier protein SoxY [Usitatibacter sp.]